MWYSLLLPGYKPVHHITVLNTVGNCNTIVSIVNPNIEKIQLKYGIKDKKWSTDMGPLPQKELSGLEVALDESASGW